MKYLCLMFLTTFVLGSCHLLEDEHEQNIEIPAAIQEYITANYPDFTTDEAENEILCDGTEVIEVELENSNDEEVELVFSLENVLIYAEVEINIDELPTVIMDAIASNYASHDLKEAERLEFTDDTIQYEVELKNGSTELDVIFASDGIVICEETE